jgi:hypothetical protein
MRTLRMVAESTEAWLVSLRENLSEVEQDTEEAFANRRTLVLSQRSAGPPTPPGTRPASYHP